MKPETKERCACGRFGCKQPCRQPKLVFKPARLERGKRTQYSRLGDHAK